MNVLRPAVHRPYCSGDTSKYTVLPVFPAFAAMSANVACMSATSACAVSSRPTSAPIMAIISYTSSRLLPSLTTT